MSFPSPPASTDVSLLPGPITFHPLRAAMSGMRVTLANKTAHPIAYKLKSNNRDRYSARPIMGVLPVGNSVDASKNSTVIELVIRAFPSPPTDAGATCRDKFYFLFTPWSSDDGDAQPAQEHIAAFWNRVDKASVREEERSIVLDMDAYDASDRDGSGRECDAETQPSGSSSESSFSTGIDGDPARRDSAVGKRRAECVICMDSAASHAFTPCGHYCACSGCAAALLRNAGGQPTCPVCRATAEGCLRIFA